MHTVRNKGDLDSGIKTKPSNLALQSYLNIMLYSKWYNNLLYSDNYYKKCIFFLSKLDVKLLPRFQKNGRVL